MKKFATAIHLLAALVLVLAINLIAGMTLGGAKLDLTEERLYTLSEGSSALVSNLDQDVRIKLYFSKRAANSVPQLRQYAERVLEILKRYESSSGGSIALEVLEPRPDTEIEEAALRHGLRPVQLGQGQEDLFFGLVIVGELGDEQSMPFIAPDREPFLEYDISSLISTVANPVRGTIGVMSALPILGGPANDPMARISGAQPQPAWTIAQELGRSFELVNVPLGASEIGAEIDLLLVIHPKAIPPASEYAIDQFVLRGGRVIALVDPLAMVEMMSSGDSTPQDRMSKNYESNLPKLLPAWGLDYEDGKVVGDVNLATAMRMGGGAGGEYPNFLTLSLDQMNQDEIVSSNMENVFLANAGHFKKSANAKYEMTSLLWSSEKAGEFDAFMLKFGGDPDRLRRDLKPGADSVSMCWKITGKFSTAFPDGPPAGWTPAPADPGADGPSSPTAALTQGEDETTIIVFSDVDFIADPFSVRKQNFFGTTLATLINDNINLFKNSVEMLVGSQDLINLRTRGRSARPFTRVDELQHQAQLKYKTEEDRLNQELDETNRRIRELEGGRDESGKTVLSASQLDEIKNFRTKLAENKAKLREVRKNLREDIENLGMRLKVINIALMPLLALFLSLVPAAWRSFKMNL